MLYTAVANVQRWLGVRPSAQVAQDRHDETRSLIDEACRTVEDVNVSRDAFYREVRNRGLADVLIDARDRR
jgi:hypothetical protein